MIQSVTFKLSKAELEILVSLLQYGYMHLIECDGEDEGDLYEEEALLNSFKKLAY